MTKMVYLSTMILLAAPCAVGAEKVLSNELKQLGYFVEGTRSGRVFFYSEKPFDGPFTEGVPPAIPSDTDLAAAYRANLCLRTADRVYICLARFEAREFDVLFEGVRAIPWQHWFRKDVRVVVDKVRTHKSRLESEHSIQGVVHKAIYTRLGNEWKMTNLPETGSQASVRVYLEQDEALVLLDLSGMPLHRRGYRTTGGDAPIRETLAAILLQLMNWRRKIPLHDAFCGSGTIALEAMLYAHNIAPGLSRSFALETLQPFTTASVKERMVKVRQDAVLSIRTDCLVRISGSDIDPNILVAARANAERAGAIAGRALMECGNRSQIARPSFFQASFDELASSSHRSRFPDEGLFLSNPPYGERLGDSESALALYAAMRSLPVSFPDWEFGLITSHKDFERAYGRRADKKKTLKGGNLETCLYMYTKER